MGRLIDADESKDIIDGNENLIDLQKDEMKLCIDACETAYDVEAVVWKLAELRDSFHGGTLQEYYFKGALEMAIDIVKKGGVK